MHLATLGIGNVSRETLGSHIYGLPKIKVLDIAGELGQYVRDSEGTYLSNSWQHRCLHGRLPRCPEIGFPGKKICLCFGCVAQIHRVSCFIYT